jgi:hypothetical protein
MLTLIEDVKFLEMLNLKMDRWQDMNYTTRSK